MLKKLIASITTAIFSILMGVLPMHTALAASNNNTIQDTKRAAQYFEDELNFKTNPYGVKSMLDGKVKNVTIVDVRAAKDYAEGHIPGAINVPYEKYNSFNGDETEFPGLRKDGFNYVYCYELLCNLGQKAGKKFAAAGYPVKEIVGGFAAWKEKDYPIDRS